MPRILSTLFAAIVFFSSTSLVVAQSLQDIFADVSVTFPVADTQAVDGDILISTDQGLVRATDAYNSALFGVVKEESVLLFKQEGEATIPVARGGVVRVNVTTLGGDIKHGDYVTSSEVAGKGQRADATGYVIGVAMGTFSQTGTQTVSGKQVKSGTIPVALKVEYAELSTPRSAPGPLDQLSAAFSKNIQNPERFVQIIKYVTSGLIMLASLLVGFLTFSRSISNGVEAIGRNPLAKGSIYFSIGMNMAFTLGIAAIGIIASFLIIRL